MNHLEEITKAIGAHGMWKRRLLTAVAEARSTTTPEQVEADNQCDFGRWLHSLTPADRASDHFKRVQALHAAFHREAAKVLRLALTGQRLQAEKSLQDGPYAAASLDLTGAMMDWKKAVNN